MAISSKDLESLWQRYKVEAVPAAISVNNFSNPGCYSHGYLPYFR